ncbi:uncharacterized protein LOC132944306 [Metopolophium dirhodum]|uniref:uncharacterized protein LOC132944306 n=1 Tax=Metopolophium dirhodum TaxID=44670 RepID=UPI0029905886|nr:uncharacterized protein LOC132944306 [Metopolophium dirhodum]XP_060869568.1 uncharacterized protein LOC132944306 [Metopolophium dirhodum]XP_060869569.1 uncharacterized protein LOC132944306 [Metopolophium dirhodum]
MDYFRNILLLETTERTSRKLGRELHGDNALKYGRRGGTAAAELRELARAVQSGSARLEGHHATRYAIRQAQRASYTAGDSHPYVRATGHRNTRRARWTQLTTAFADTVPYVQTPS